MKIRDAVKPELIFLDLKAGNADQAIASIADAMGRAAALDSEMIYEALVEREGLGSTSVGNGFALPHCKLERLESIVVALARVDVGVDFSDGKNHDPVRFFFVVLSPPEQPAEHLRVLSQIARILKRSELREELLQSADPSAVISSIRRSAEQEGL